MNPYSARLVAPLLIGSLLNPINSTMISTALVPIGRDFHAAVARRRRGLAARCAHADDPRPAMLLLVGSLGLLMLDATTAAVLVAALGITFGVSQGLVSTGNQAAVYA